jgi:hypothetical protein
MPMQGFGIQNRKKFGPSRIGRISDFDRISDQEATKLTSQKNIFDQILTEFDRISTEF